MKVILDVGTEFRNDALAAIQQVETQFPDQEIGKGNGISVSIQSNNYTVIRNLNSYTAVGENQTQFGVNDGTTI